jgi:hypothetical protein
MQNCASGCRHCDGGVGSGWRGQKRSGEVPRDNEAGVKSILLPRAHFEERHEPYVQRLMEDA